MRDAQPNTTHFALAALQHSSVVQKIVTQNVDGLHHKAISHVWSEGRMQEQILELHGQLRVSLLHHEVRDGSSRCAHKECSMCSWPFSGQRHVPDAAFRCEPTVEGLHGRARSYRPETANKSRWRCEYRFTAFPVFSPTVQVALEGVNYDEFVVPDCPTCLSQNRHNNVVRSLRRL